MSLVYPDPGLGPLLLLRRLPVFLRDPLVLGGDGGELRLVLRPLPGHRRRLGVPAHRRLLVPRRDGRVQLLVFRPENMGNMDRMLQLLKKFLAA